ncbi:U3 small nucleolar ribonucleoprotein IMP4 [Sarcoptes scabiei]|nr:U3 small nucleolar ribonucleoprotein IMP4 [Sarcoptes scabiei]
MSLELTGCQRILKFLFDDAIQKKEFEKIANNFRCFIQSEYDFNFQFKFEIGRFLVQLLFHHSVLLPKFSHKIITLFLLYDLYNWPVKIFNPFNGIIYDILNISTYKNCAIYFQFIHDFNKFFKEKFQNFQNNNIAFFEDYFDIIDKFDFLVEENNLKSSAIEKNLICDFHTNSTILPSKLQLLSKHLKKAIREKVENDFFGKSDFVKMHEFIEKVSSQTNHEESISLGNQSHHHLNESKSIPKSSTTTAIYDFNDLTEERYYSQHQHEFIPKYFIENFEKPVAIDIYTVYEFPHIPTIARNFFISLFLMDDYSRKELLKLSPNDFVECDFLPQEIAIMKEFRSIILGQNYRLLQMVVFERLQHHHHTPTSTTSQQHNSTSNFTLRNYCDQSKNFNLNGELNEYDWINKLTKTITKKEFLEQISAFENESFLYYFPFFPPIKTAENEHFDL